MLSLTGHRNALWAQSSPFLMLYDSRFHGNDDRPIYGVLVPNLKSFGGSAFNKCCTK